MTSSVLSATTYRRPGSSDFEVPRTSLGETSSHRSHAASAIFRQCCATLINSSLSFGSVASAALHSACSDFARYLCALDGSFTPHLAKGSMLPRSRLHDRGSHLLGRCYRSTPNWGMILGEHRQTVLFLIQIGDACVKSTALVRCLRYVMRQVCGPTVASLERPRPHHRKTGTLENYRRATGCCN
jgi:hypothetical protein